ncbi:G5 domain-containing protein [Asanoa sp. NPDC049573]|uniref:G5 domain-containing protein n=1 Tax=Asanoa sp. NPDC049573 TaxID=3155396 RepID=UPI00341FF794
MTYRGARLGLLAVVAAVVFVAGCGSPQDTATRPVDVAVPIPAGLGTAAPETSAAQTPEAEPTTEAPAQPVVEKKMVRETQRIAFSTRTVKDSSLASGTKKVRTKGVAGQRTITYEVTYTDGKQTAKKQVSSTITKAPVTQVVAVGTKTSTRACDPNYSGCVPIASDVDCSGGGGNGPAYVQGPVRVIGSDIYDLDRDGDGIGCDS